MLEATHIGNNGFNVFGATDAPFNVATVIANGAVVGKNTMGIETGAEEGNTIFYGNAKTFFGVKGQIKPSDKIF